MLFKQTNFQDARKFTVFLGTNQIVHFADKKKKRGDNTDIRHNNNTINTDVLF